MRIGVIGGGSIGLFIAAKMSEQQHEVTLYVRSKKQAQIIQDQQVRCLPDSKQYQVKAKQFNENTYVGDELVFICVKQYDLEDILDKFHNFSGVLIFLQNGMGHIDLIKHHNLVNQIFIGTCEHAARKEDEATVAHTGVGKINLSLYQGEASLLKKYSQHLSRLNFKIEIKEDWYHLLLDKLIINGVINPITAVHQIKNGGILTNSYLNEIAFDLTKEIAQALSMDPDKQWARVQEIAERTKGNDSSMKVDVELGRRTEIDGILGYVQKHAATPAPLVEYYYQSIKALE